MKQKHLENIESEFEHYFSEKPVGEYKQRKINAYIRGRSYFFETASGIFSYKNLDKGTEVLLKYLDFPAEGNILDLGAGYGPIGIVVAKELESLQKHNFFFSEVNKRAIWVLKKNIRNYNIKKYRIISGNFVEKAKKLKEENIKFKAIYCNPPNRAGLEIIFDMFHAAIDLMDEDGFMQYVIKKSYGAESFAGRIITEFPNQDIFCTGVKSGYRVYTVVNKGKFNQLFPNMININVDDNEIDANSGTMDQEQQTAQSDILFEKYFQKEYPEPEQELINKFDYSEQMVEKTSDDNDEEESSEDNFDRKFENHQFRESTKKKRKMKRRKRARTEECEETDEEILNQYLVDENEDFSDELEMGEDASDLFKEDEKGKKKIVFGSPFKIDFNED